MRILVLSNFYPPHDRGGYEQLCGETCDRLTARGHEVLVLTSNYQADETPRYEQKVRRVLSLDSDLNYYRVWDFFLARRRKERRNLMFLADALNHFQPDVFFVWGMWNLSRTLPVFVEQRQVPPVVYWLSDLWPSEPDKHAKFWSQTAKRPWLHLPRSLLNRTAQAILTTEGKPIKPLFQHVICVSATVKDNLVRAGLPMQQAQVIRHGIDMTLFSANSNRRERQPGALSIVYVGGLAHHKGVHTLIGALAHLVNQRQAKKMTVTLVGAGHPGYEAALKRLVEEHNLAEYVSFYGSVPHEGIPSLLPQFDCLVFPSICEEALGRSHMEAMASGVAVVSTTKGGIKEVVTDESNALTFPAGDAVALANQLERLAADPTLARNLVEAGRQTVLEKFSVERMVDQVEQYLFTVAEEHQCA